MDSHLYVRGQCLVMSEEPIPKDETTHGEHNRYSIQIKLHTIQLWEVTPTRRKLHVKLNLTDRTNFFISFTLHRFLIPAPKLTIVAWGQFLAVEDAGRRCIQGDCEDIFCHSYLQFQGGKEQKKPEENDEAAIIQNVHLALPTSSAKAFWERVKD